MRTIVAMCGVLMACGNGVTVDNSNPTGLVGGVIVDAATEMPIQGATIHIVSAGGAVADQTTAADGTFQATKVPAGSLILSVTNMGYQTATFSTFLAGSVGNFPVKDPTLTIGPLGLIKNDGTFVVRVVDQNGAPAAMIKMIARTHVRYVDLSSGNPYSQGSYEVTATSGADGLATFMGLPEYASLGGTVNSIIDIDVPATQVMGNSYAFLGLTQSFDTLSVGSQTPTIVLAGPNTGLTILDSNIGSVAATAPLLPPTGPITMAFNQAIDPGSVRAQFQNEAGVTVAIMASAQANTNLLTITPATALSAGARYNLLLHVSSAYSNANPGHELDKALPFFITPTGQPTISAKASTPAGGTLTTITITFSEPVGLGSGVSGAQSCVAWYEGLGLNLNNNGANPAYNPFAGVWSSAASVQSIPCNASSLWYGFDITALTPKYDSPATGFSSVWTGSLSDSANPCSGCAADCSLPATPYTCNRPGTGNTLHVLFSRVGLANGTSGTIHRVNGSPMQDMMALIN
jgi:hypothetical protein